VIARKVGEGGVGPVDWLEEVRSRTYFSNILSNSLVCWEAIMCWNVTRKSIWWKGSDGRFSYSR